MKHPKGFIEWWVKWDNQDPGCSPDLPDNAFVAIKRRNGSVCNHPMRGSHLNWGNIAAYRIVPEFPGSPPQSASNPPKKQTFLLWLMSNAGALPAYEWTYRERALIERISEYLEQDKELGDGK